MADITKLASLDYLQQVRPTNRKWQLAQRMTVSDTQALVNFEPTDESGGAITVPFEVTIGVERMLVTSYTGALLDVTRGLARGGLDFTGAAANAEAHDDGDEVAPSVSPLMIEMYYRCFLGTIATSGTAFRIGNEADDDIFLYAQNADANKPYLKYDKTTSAWVLSNDGVAEVSLASGGVSTSSLGIAIVGADIRLDFTDTTAIIETTAGAGDSGKLVKTDAAGVIKQANIEVWKDVTATAAEINKIDGTSANVTTANINTSYDGGDASAFHTHDKGDYVSSGNDSDATAAVVAIPAGANRARVNYTCNNAAGTNISGQVYVDANVASHTIGLNASSGNDDMAGTIVWSGGNVTLTKTLGSTVSMTCYFYK